MQAFTIVLAVLLLAGTVEAGNDDWSMRPYGGDYSACTIWQESNGPIKTACPQLKAEGIWKIEPGDTSCYERMRESMKAVDAYNKQEQVSHGAIPLSIDLNVGMQLKKQWDAVMRECVRQ